MPRPAVTVAAAALTTVLAGAALTGCARGLSREQIRTGYRDELVKTGVPAPVATCVTDKLFAGMDDDALRAFQRRERLTDDEKAEVGTYSAECLASGT